MSWGPSSGWRTSRRLRPARSHRSPPRISSRRGRAELSGLAHPRGLSPALHRHLVRNLQAAGAAVLGKTNQDEFAMGSSTENSGYGPARTRGTGRACQVARGGSAAAVAAGYAPWAIGTDTGGSIRQPASLCGIVGMKPTYGAVSRYGMIAFASSLDQCGPLTRDVTDAALMLRLLQGRDPATRPRSASRARSPCRAPSGWTACASASGASRRRASSRGGGGGARHAHQDRGARRLGRAGRDAERGPRPGRLLRDRPPRRAPTWPATTACATGCAPATGTSPTCTSRPATTALATRSSGAS